MTPPGARSHVPRGVVCIFCHYDLERLELRDRCPECGRAVRASVQRWLLLRFTPARRDQVVSGTRFMLIGLVGLILFGPAAPAAAWMFFPTVLDEGYTAAARLLIIAAGGVHAAIWLSFGVGLRRINIALEREQRAASSMRLAWIAAAVGALALLVGGLEPAETEGGLAIALWSLAALTVLVLAVVLLLWASETAMTLSTRLPSTRLMSLSRGALPVLAPVAILLSCPVPIGVLVVLVVATLEYVWIASLLGRCLRVRKAAEQASASVYPNGQQRPRSARGVVQED